jgi:murein DD-endopeptidase MepM/ murein hydrolase activator NlpD
MTTGGLSVKDKKSWTRRIGDFLAGKGFYVVLFVCTAVIGVSAWILLFTGNRPDEADTGSIASAQVSQEVIAPTDNGDTDAFSTDTLGQKPTVTPASPSASAKPSASANPSAGPATTKPNNNSEGNSAAAMAKQLTYTWPVVGDIAVVYSVEELIYNETMSDWRTHDGIDIAGVIGTKVVATADGTVTDVKSDDLLGTTVIIDHGNGLVSIYANLAKTPVVKTGDKVAMGAVIGAIGDTALGETNETSHLHFAMAKDNLPVDPIKYLPQK